MTGKLFTGALCALLGAASAGTISAPAPGLRAGARQEAPPGLVRYLLTPVLAESPRALEVRMGFTRAMPGDRILLQSPVWSPGDYHVQQHGRYVQNLTARDADTDRPLMVTHPDQNSWEITPEEAKRIAVTYRLPSTPPGFFSENVQLKESLVFVNGPAAYLYIVNQKERPVELTLRLPAGWRAETALPSVERPDPGTAVFTAPDYDSLADSPVVMADSRNLVARPFTVEGVPHRAVFFNRTDQLAGMDGFVSLLRQIVTAERKIMDGGPYVRYSFLFDVGGRGGGLEHLNSCRIGLWSTQDLKSVAPLVAHEFFHLWNVKRIRPRVLGPFDYIHPPATRNLWFAEGVTDYYAYLATRRAGLLTDAEFFGHWRSEIKSWQNRPRRTRVTADESSLRVWEAGNSSGYGFSYYLKGALIGLCLDLKIRKVTDNRKSLDDVMRALLRATNPPKPGYEEDGLREAINRVSGVDLSEFYDLLARSTQEMPFEACLRYAGLDSEVAARADATDAQKVLRRGWLQGSVETDAVR